MTTETAAPVELIWAAFTAAAHASPMPFEYGGRKRKNGADPFAKFSRNVVWADLPDTSKLFIVQYGVQQYTADGMNTATTDSEAMAGVDSRLAKLAAGDFTRERGEPGVTNDPEVLANSIAREELSALIAAQKLSLTKEQRAAATVAYRAKEATRLVALATKRIADRTANAAAFDLSAFLTPAEAAEAEIVTDTSGNAGVQ